LESTQEIPWHKQDFLIRGLKSTRPRKLIRSFKIPQVWTASGNDNDGSRVELSFGEACIFLPRLGLPFPVGVAGLFIADSSFDGTRLAKS
jgi:hypothetical protein